VADEVDRSAELIEQLLGDPQLRASFRADPGSVLRDHGLAEMADGLPADRRAMLTLELRESRSSLAGVIVAAAAESVDFTHVAEHAAPRLGRDAGRAISHLVKKLSSHAKPRPAPAAKPIHHLAPAPAKPVKPHLESMPALPAMAKPASPPVEHLAAPAAPVQAEPPPPAPTVHHDSVTPEPVDAAPAAVDPLQYPGDDASSAQIAAWMGANAQRAGLPPELPVMAALTESGLRNLDYGDRDSVGFFQMRVGIWDQGAYTGYPTNPQLQLQWFINEALAARQSDPSLSQDPNSWGDWVADVERPAAEYRYRYQLQLPEAQALIRPSGLPAAPSGGAAIEPAGPSGGAPVVAGEPVQPVFHGVIHRTPLGHAVSTTATACVGAKCTPGGSDVQAGFDGAGLVKYAYGKQGIDLPSAPEQQFAVGAAVTRAALQRGDAVFFGRSPDDIENVGIYVGDGKVITAASEKSAVSIDSLNGATSHYLGARRYSEKLLTGAASYARTLPTIKPTP
jgi:cell wall-associated NlpC family hydrolase